MYWIIIWLCNIIFRGREGVLLVSFIVFWPYGPGGCFQWDMLSGAAAVSSLLRLTAASLRRPPLGDGYFAACILPSTVQHSCVVKCLLHILEESASMRTSGGKLLVHGWWFSEGKEEGSVEGAGG